MLFLDPTSDIAFKKLFGTTKHKDILISFLNSVLDREEGTRIVDVTITDPYNHRERADSKLSIVDARCTDEQGKQYILEMQATTEHDYKQRCLYYASLALSRQLDDKDPYKKLDPVIFVGVLDFNLFMSNDYVSHISLLNKKTGEHALPDLEFHFVELKKFDKEIADIDNIHDDVDKWIYLLKYANKLHTIPTTFKKTKAVVHAFEVLEQGSWSKEELNAYDRFIDAMRSQKSQIESAREEGELKGKLDVAQQLLDILDVETIAQKTRLSIEDIQRLKKN